MDLGESEKIAARLRRLQRIRATGDGFATFDAALQALRAHPESLALAYQATLQAARIGAFTVATQLFHECALGRRAHAEADQSGVSREDLLALSARLKKDRALDADGPKRSSMLRETAEAYQAVYEHSRGYYPLINVATIYALAGDDEKSRRAASEALSLLRHGAAAADSSEELWRLLTEIEALLILGDLDGATSVSAKFAGAFKGDYGDLSTTLRQLGRLVAAKGLSFDVGRALGMPAVLHYAGHRVASPGSVGRFPAEEERSVTRKIDEFLQSTPVGWAYGSLAAGADILIAEQLLKRGAHLHVVLPFETSDFVKVSVEPSGADWVRRFEKCLGKAATTRTVIDGGYFRDDGLFAACSAYALGLGKLRAQDLCAELRQLLVWDGQKDETAIAGTAADYRLGESLGIKLHTIALPPVAAVEPVRAAEPLPGVEAANARRRRPRAMVFCDVVGFSRIRDDDLPVFHEQIWEPMAKRIHALPTRPVLVETWGDAVFLVYDDVLEAAAAAMELCNSLGTQRQSAASLLDALAVRVSAHYGSTFDVIDPFTGRSACLGTHVSRAARIEPVTPPGVVYVSESFAARLAIKDSPLFRTEFVGTTKLAKKFGSLPIFRLVVQRRDRV